MAKDLNQCSFIGRLGKDVEMRYMPSGEACANFSIAVGESWKDKTTGEKKEKTEWVNISCFGKLAEICGEYLKKGSKIYASGSMETRKWQDQSGADRYSTGIKLKDMQMLDSAQQGQQQNAPQQQQSQGNAPQQQHAPQQQQSWGNAPQSPQQQQAPAQNAPAQRAQHPAPQHAQQQQQQQQAPQQQQNGPQYAPVQQDPNEPPF